MSVPYVVAAGGLCDGCGARLTADVQVDEIPNNGANVSLTELLGSPATMGACPICRRPMVMLVIGVTQPPWQINPPPDDQDPESAKLSEKAYERMQREDAAEAERRGGRLDALGGDDHGTAPTR